MSEKKIRKEVIHYFDRDIIGKYKDVVRLFNRQGKLIKESIETGDEWIGLYNGEQCYKENVEIFYFYNDNGELISKQTIDLLKASQVREEYSNGRKVKSIHEDEGCRPWICLYTYDSKGQMVDSLEKKNFEGLKFDSLGRFDTYNGLHYEYDEQNHLIKITRENDYEYLERYIYDSLGRLITEESLCGLDYTFVNYNYIGITNYLYQKTWWQRYSYDEITRIEIYDEYNNHDASRKKFINGEVGKLKEYLAEVRTFGEVDCIEKFQYNENGDCILKTITKGSDTHTEEILYEYNEDGICTFCVNLWTDEGYSHDFEYFEE